MPTPLTRHVLTILAFVLASSVVLPGAQWPTGQIRELLNKASLHRFVDGDPPVTTGLDDALTGVDFLDNFNPSRFAPLGAQPRDNAGGFLVGPGAYEFVAESYCLHAGTHGPGGGDGYVSAPLLGARRDIVRHILQNAVAHPEISQQEVQVLLWAVLARTRMSDMPPKTQVTAARLLTPRQLLDLQGGAFGVLPNRTWQSLPLAARRAYEAETQFRQLLTTVDASFADIERFAVLGGDPASDPASRKIPEGRWSYHPGGYFIRFFPTGYSSTDVQLFVPEPTRATRESGRPIATIEDDRGRFHPTFEMAAAVWASEFCEQTGRCPSGIRRVDLSETVAVPGNRGRQRLGLSGRGQR